MIPLGTEKHKPIHFRLINETNPWLDQVDDKDLAQQLQPSESLSKSEKVGTFILFTGVNWKALKILSGGGYTCYLKEKRS